MSLADFTRGLLKEEHEGYRESILSPVAPEYSTGEVLLGAAYRKLVLGVAEREVDLAEIATLPTQLSPPDAWTTMLGSAGGLASPARAGQGRVRLPQLMPLVPEVGRRACVLGRPRSRWDPGNLLVSTLASGVGPVAVPGLLASLRNALQVEDSDDIFARFVDDSLRSLAAPTPSPADPPAKGPAWRSQVTGSRTPAERFAGDLQTLLALKPRLTRRQWTVLIEACLRLGLAAHYLWVCRLNARVWALVLEAFEGGAGPTPAEVEHRCWMGHDSDDPLLELGRNAVPTIKKRIQEYLVGRIGFNIALHALDEAGAPWQPGGVGVPTPGTQESPPEAIAAFIAHVASSAPSIGPVIQAQFGHSSLRRSADELADANPRQLAALSGSTKNIFEFLRYSIGQLQTQADEQKAYDQAFVLYRRDRRTNSPWPVQPGPAALIMMVHACCQSLGGLPASLDDFAEYLAEYGIHAPAGEITAGPTGRDLERLGLVVDSPDAGGGRLLVDPF
jgi:hypothetical protein